MGRLDKVRYQLAILFSLTIILIPVASAEPLYDVCTINLNPPSGVSIYSYKVEGMTDEGAVFGVATEATSYLQGAHPFTSDNLAGDLNYLRPDVLFTPYVGFWPQFSKQPRGMSNDGKVLFYQELVDASTGSLDRFSGIAGQLINNRGDIIFRDYSNERPAIFFRDGELSTINEFEVPPHTFYVWPGPSGDMDLTGGTFVHGLSDNQTAVGVVRREAAPSQAFWLNVGEPGSEINWFSTPAGDSQHSWVSDISPNGRWVVGGQKVPTPAGQTPPPVSNNVLLQWDFQSGSLDFDVIVPAMRFSSSSRLKVNDAGDILFGWYQPPAPQESGVYIYRDGTAYYVEDQIVRGGMNLYMRAIDMDSRSNILVRFSGNTSPVYAVLVLVPEFTRGDLNEDGRVDSRDLDALELHLSDGTQIPEPIDRADVNDDEVVNDLDVRLLERYVRTGRVAIPEPFARPGPDVTGDACDKFARN